MGASNFSSPYSSTPPFSSVSSPSFNSSASPTAPPCQMEIASLRQLLAVVYSLCFVFGLVCNLFALWVFLFVDSKRNSVRVFLINCAVADLVLLACLPFRVSYHARGDKWVLGSLACKLVGNAFYVNMYISILLLGFISLDRFLRLRGKRRARRGCGGTLCGRTQMWSWGVCGSLWGISFLLFIVMVATAENKDVDKCFHYRRNPKGIICINAAAVFLFWVVFAMLIISYSKISGRLLQVSRDRPDLPNAHKYARTAKKSFFVLFLFTVCFGPYHAFRPVYIHSQLSKDPLPCDYQKLMDRTNELMLLLSAFNSCLDPVMYFLLSGSVRKTAVRALGPRLCSWLCCDPGAKLDHSSTMEFRRPSVAVSLQATAPNTPCATPRTSICAMNLRRAGVTLLPPAGH
uniref:Probable G-protein coupled receptor 34 n=1 Tax=Oryzias latipes TaxID=8090 RepID=A0A3P9L7N0_ORYLA